MKIIQSYFFKEKAIFGNSKENDKRWNSFKSALTSICLSALLLNKHVGKVFFIGNDWLIDFIKNDVQIDIEEEKLPFQKKKLNLIEGLWAQTKLLIYSEMDEPFLHFDSDFFVWKPLPSEIFTCRVVAQEPECDDTYPYNWQIIYKPFVEQIKKELKNVPTWWNVSVDEEKKNLTIYNMGVFGGTDLNLINRGAKEILDFIDANFSILNEKTVDEISKLMHVFEQYGISRFLKWNDAKPFTLIKTAYERLFFGIREEMGFSHFINMEKKRKQTEEKIEKAFQEQFPREWEKLKKSLEEKENFQWKR